MPKRRTNEQEKILDFFFKLFMHSGPCFKDWDIGPGILSPTGRLCDWNGEPPIESATARTPSGSLVTFYVQKGSSDNKISLQATRHDGKETQNKSSLYLGGGTLPYEPAILRCLLQENEPGLFALPRENIRLKVRELLNAVGRDYLSSARVGEVQYRDHVVHITIKPNDHDLSLYLEGNVAKSSPTIAHVRGFVVAPNVEDLIASTEAALRKGENLKEWLGEGSLGFDIGPFQIPYEPKYLEYLVATQAREFDLWEEKK